jgi:heat shock protein HslJ
VQSGSTLKGPSETPKSTEIPSDSTSGFSRYWAPIHNLLGEWLIEDLDRRGVMDNVEVTLKFDNEGRVSGQQGCNVVTGRFTNDMASLSFGPLLSTRKMCGSPALMNQENSSCEACKCSTL